MQTKIDSNYIISLAKEGKREDGRGLMDSRELSIETDYIGNAEGSAYVRLGETEVLAGVKMSLATPFPDSPNEGILMVNAELGPKASPDFELGPPKETAVELSRVIDRGIRESKAIDVEKLCVTPGEQVWMVSVDIDIINNAGNMMDAAGIAAITALLTAKVPGITEDGKVDRDSAKDKLPVNEIPIPVTTYKVGDSLMLDVNDEEEDASSARLTVTSIEKVLCAMQKSGEGRFKVDDVYKIVEESFNRAKEIRKQVKSAAK